MRSPAVIKGGIVGIKGVVIFTPFYYKDRLLLLLAVNE